MVKVRLYVKAWTVRKSPRLRPQIHPPGGAPDVRAPRPERALFTSEPSGGTGSVGLHAAKVSEIATPVEEACRRSFYLAEICRGRERWRSAPLADKAAARKAQAGRERIYTAQGYEVKRGLNLSTVSGRGVSFEIRIRKEVA